MPQQRHSPIVMLALPQFKHSFDDLHFLTKTEVAMNLELTPAEMGYPEEEGLVTMYIIMDMLAYNYNQPVSIELPPEAEEAVEVPSLF